MNETDQLFQLISALSKNEKRYFKVYASRHKNNNNFIKLFNVVGSQKKYDEKEILQICNKENFAKHLNQTKHKLYNFILQSLGAFNANSSVSTQINSLLHSVDILFEKDLYKQSIKLINKAKILAYQYEKYEMVLEVIELERKAIGPDEKKQEMLFKETEQILKELSNISQYQYLRNLAYCEYYREGTIRDPRKLKVYENILKNPLMKGVEFANTFRAKLYFHIIYTLIYFQKKDLENAYIHSKSLVKLLDSKPELMADVEWREKYITIAVFNFLYISKALKRYDEIKITIEKLSKMRIKTAKEKAQVFYIKNFHMLGMLSAKGEFSKALPYMKEIEEGFNFCKGKITQGSLMEFYLSIFNIYFGTKDYSKALYWLNGLLNETTLQSREDIHGTARIINIILHYEMGNQDILEYLIRSAYLFFKKRKKLYKFENSILDFMRKGPLKTNTPAEIIRFKVLKEELLIIFKDPLEAKVLEYFDFISWLESKIENRNFVEIVKAKAIG